MSHIHIQKLTPVRDEFQAVRAALDYFYTQWNRLQPLRDEQVAFRHLQSALIHLEDTYIIRIFAEFEGILRDFLLLPPGRQDRRSIYYLIDRVALRQHIPDAVRDDVHILREYRNLLAHRRAAGARTIPFAQSLAFLNRYLAYL